MLKVTLPVVELVGALIAEGYEGTAEFAKAGHSGTEEILEGAFAVRLSGFCKESLYIVEDCSDWVKERTFLLIGRYSTLDRLGLEGLTVEAVVDLAWSMFLDYEGRGYAMPHEFRSLFVKYGHLTAVTKEVTTYERL